MCVCVSLYTNPTMIPSICYIPSFFASSLVHSIGARTLPNDNIP